MSRNRKIVLGVAALAALCGVCGIVWMMWGLISDGTGTTTVTPSVVASMATQTPEARVVQPLATSENIRGGIPFQSVVLISAYYEENGQLIEGWTGSGSIISRDGLILTNAHVVLPDRYMAVDALIVSLTVEQDEPPVASYFAEVLQANAAMDLAVIGITTDMDGNAVDLAALNLPVVTIGESDTLSLGDRLTIIGYPGIGGQTITLTTGEVSGFTAEADYGNRAFIKTSATIAGGNSGGLASNEKGELIGVPTQLGYGGDDQFVDCRRVADTNRDGLVDESDNCVPTGGFINSLRPVKMALTMIEAAARGEILIVAEELAPAQSSEDTSGSLLYQDDFSDENSGWDVSADQYGSTAYRDGAYEISVTDTKYLIWVSTTEEYQNTLNEITAQVAQETAQGDFGFVCGYRDNDNFYGLEISEDHYASIWKYVNGEFVSLVEWTYFSNLENTSTYNLQAVCAGNKLSLAVNGALLVEATDDTLPAGGVGMIVGTWETPDIVVAFDDLKIFNYQP